MLRKKNPKKQQIYKRKIEHGTAILSYFLKNMFF